MHIEFSVLWTELMPLGIHLRFLWDLLGYCILVLQLSLFFTVNCARDNTSKLRPCRFWWAMRYDHSMPWVQLHHKFNRIMGKAPGRCIHITYGYICQSVVQNRMDMDHPCALYGNIWQWYYPKSDWVREVVWGGALCDVSVTDTLHSSAHKHQIGFVATNQFFISGFGEQTCMMYPYYTYNDPPNQNTANSIELAHFVPMQRGRIIFFLSDSMITASHKFSILKSRWKDTNANLISTFIY